MKPDDIDLEQTSGNCPEQYDAFHQGKKVGYLRLRYSQFRIDVPDCGEKKMVQLFSTLSNQDMQNLLKKVVKIIKKRDHTVY